MTSVVGVAVQIEAFPSQVLGVVLVLVLGVVLVLVLGVVLILVLGVGVEGCLVAVVHRVVGVVVLALDPLVVLLLSRRCRHHHISSP